MKHASILMKFIMIMGIFGAFTLAVAAYVGSNVSYARAHEFGLHDTVAVKEHQRFQQVAFGKPMKNPRQVTVRAHTMRMNLPERSFLRSALSELQPQIRDQIQAAMHEAIQ